MTRVLSFLLVGFVLLPGVVETAVIVVDTTHDELNSDGDCSLREAVAATNNNSAVDNCPSGNIGPDAILFAVNGTIFLNLGPLAVTGTVSILGPGSDLLTIDGGNQRIFEVNMTAASFDLTVQQLTLRHGFAIGGDGGALWVGAVDQVTVDRVVFDMNAAVTGGAIGFSRELDEDFNRMSITRCLFSENTASEAGGAIAVSTMTNNAVKNFDAIEVSDTQFSENAAAGPGGAAFAVTGGDLVFERCVFVGNKALDGGGGAVYTLGPVSPGPTLVLKNSLLVANEASETGGAIVLWGLGLYLVDTTMVRNSAHGDSNPATIFAVPMSGSVKNANHSIIADTLVGVDCIMDGIDSFGYNLDSDGSCPFDLASDQQNSDPLIGGITDLGGWTMTALPSASSPVIDSGDASGAFDEAGVLIVEDQLSNPRPVDGDGIGGAVCDRGSIEVWNDWDGLFIDGFEEGSGAAWN